MLHNLFKKQTWMALHCRHLRTSLDEMQGALAKCANLTSWTATFEFFSSTVWAIMIVIWRVWLLFNTNPHLTANPFMVTEGMKGITQINDNVIYSAKICRETVDPSIHVDASCQKPSAQPLLQSKHTPMAPTPPWWDLSPSRTVCPTHHKNYSGTARGA